MRVAVVCALNGKGSKIPGIAKSLSMALESKGNLCDVIDIKSDNDKKLTIYDYLIIVSEPVSYFSGKVPENIGKYLENAGVVSGKRAATVIVGGLLKQKAMSNLMRIVEGQGIILKTSEFIKSEGEAKAFGSNLKVERNY